MRRARRAASSGGRDLLNPALCSRVADEADCDCCGMCAEPIDDNWPFDEDWLEVKIYARVACSSSKRSWSLLAIKFAKAEELEDVEGI